MHNPLTAGEAVECLRDLVKNFRTAIEAFHFRDWAQLDIRLENLCFNVKFQPALIDLDHSICIFDFLCTLLGLVYIRSYDRGEA